MKKKMIVAMAIMTMGVSVLTGCTITLPSINVTTRENTEVQISTEEQTTEAETTENTEVDTEEVTTEETTVKETSASEVDAVEASLENPAQIGEWVATKKYSAEDGQYHTMYFKITGVIRGEEAAAIVDDYNAQDHAVKVSDLEDENIEYCIVTYETYFPTDFPQPEYGITSIDVNLYVCNTEDSGAIANYIGLSTVWDISEDPDINEFYAGDTFTEGKAVFAMVKDHTEYLFNASYFDEDDTEINAYVVGE